VAEQRSDEFAGFVAWRFGGGNAIGDRQGDQRSWIGECSLQPGDGQRVDAGVRACHAHGEDAGGFGANVRVGVADEGDERGGELALAETADELGSVAALLAGAGEQRSNAIGQGLVIEGPDGGGEDDGSATGG
jgi:hypothetical protein